MSTFDMSSWLSSTALVFRGLSGRDRVRTLTHLLDQCDANERWEWQTAMTERLHRDIVAWLPIELSLHILSFLDAKTLFNACQVG